MRKILLAMMLAAVSVGTFTSCGNNNNRPIRYSWEIRDSIEKAKEDSINRVLRVIRDSAEIAMSENSTVLRGIYLGQNKGDYEKQLGKIRSEIGSTTLEIGNINLRIWDEKFHNGKLYSLTLKHDYLYKEYKREYNSTPEYHPYPHIKDLITHFENKYGLPDKKYSGYDEVRGHEKADYLHMYWMFPKKRIRIKNEAEKYGGGNGHASYILTITIDDNNITDMIEKEKKRREKEQRKERERKDSILNKKKQDLSNTI